MAARNVSTRGEATYHAYRVRARGVDASFAELDILNLSVGK